MLRSALFVIALAGCNGDLVFPDDVTPGVIAGVSATDWWLGMPPPAPGEFALDARLSRYEGSFATFDTITLCRGACRHIGYGGNGLLALDQSNEGIVLASVDGVSETLPFPDEEETGAWLLAGRGDVLVAGTALRVFLRQGDSWSEQAELEAPLFSLDVDSNARVTATIETIEDGLQPALLVDGLWFYPQDLPEGALVAFEPDSTVVSAFVNGANIDVTTAAGSATIAVPEGEQFFALRMLPSHDAGRAGLLGVRVLNGALEAVFAPLASPTLDPSGAAFETWAPLGNVETVNEASFRSTVFDDGTVGVLYPGAPRGEGVGPKTVLHAAAAP